MMHDDVPSTLLSQSSCIPPYTKTVDYIFYAASMDPSWPSCLVRLWDSISAGFLSACLPFSCQKRVHCKLWILLSGLCKINLRYLAFFYLQDWWRAAVWPGRNGLRRTSSATKCLSKQKTSALCVGKLDVQLSARCYIP